MTQESTVRAFPREIWLLVRKTISPLAAATGVALLLPGGPAFAQPVTIALPSLGGHDWVVTDRVSCEGHARVATRVDGEAIARDPAEASGPWTLASDVTREVHLPGNQDAGAPVAGVHYRRARMTSATSGKLEPLALEGMTLALTPDARGVATAAADATDVALIAHDRIGDLLALSGTSIGHRVGTSWVFTPAEWRVLGGDYLGNVDGIECQEGDHQEQELILLCRGPAPGGGGMQDIRVRLSFEGPGSAVDVVTWEGTTKRQVVRAAPMPGQEIVTEESKTCAVETTQVPAVP